MNRQQSPRKPDGLMEVICLFGILLAFFWIGLAICSLHPDAWGDEVMYTDPSARYTAGKGFTSTAWPSQSSTEFWAGNCPLHQVILIPWLQVFGVSVQTVRSLNVLLVTLSAWVLWLAAKRGGCIASAGGRLCFVFLLLSSSSSTYMTHYGRPDAITLLIASGMVWAFAAAPAAWRKWLAVLLGALAPWAGLQLVAMAVAVSLFYLLLARRLALPFCGWLACGIGIGLLTLGGFYAAHGVARRFVENTLASGHTFSGQLAQLAVKRDAKAVSKASERLDNIAHFYQAWLVDSSFPWVMLCIFVSSYWAWRQKLFKIVSPLGFALTAGLGVPILVLLAGKYPEYYGWMGFLIVSFCGISAASQFWGAWPVSMRCLATAPLLAACWAGLPSDLLSGRPPAKPAEVRNFVQANLSASDRVLVDGPAYYAAVNYAAETYYMLYAGGRGLREMPGTERDAVTALVIHPSHLEVCAAKVGGRWQEAATYEMTADTTVPNRRLVVYRRIK
jgi:hypothetical protein